MNLLYLHMHDMGRYNQIYGHALETPILAALASNGTVFRNAHCAAPTCSPSRAALLCGMAPHSAGMLGLANMGFAITRPEQHLSHFLSRHGFATALFGVQHETPDVSALGYGHVFHADGDFAQQDQRTAETAARYLRDRQGGEPFFLSVGFLLPHRPFVQADKAEPIPALPPCLPDTPPIRADWANYAASVKRADDCAGIVLAAFAQSGLEEETAIVLTTDHGVAFPFMKCTPYDAGTGVSLVIKAPGMAGGTESGALTSQIDVFPTLCELLDLPKPGWLQGHSLMPILRNPAAEVNTHIFGEINYHVSYQPVRSVRTARYKYIRHFGIGTGQVLPNIDVGPSKEYLLQHGLRGLRVPREELYDLLLDPAERNNLTAADGMEGIRSSLQMHLDRWMLDTNDPLLQGEIPLPAGAITVPPACTHADGR